VYDLEIGIQFPDSENAQRSLEIVQIPRLRGTYINVYIILVPVSVHAGAH